MTENTHSDPAPNGRSRRRTPVLAAAAAILVFAAVGHWAFRLYDPGPSFTMDQVTGLQVAVEGWTDVEVDGPERDTIEAFVSASDGARALWPPDLKFP